VTTIPVKIEATTSVVKILDNEDFIKKTGETIKTEIKTNIEKEITKATKKVKNTKAKTKQDKIREKIAIQQAIIDAKKEKVQYLREERTVAKENFLEVNDLEKVTNIKEAWLTEMEASDAYITVQAKKEKVQQVNDRLELATQNRDIKKTRITLIKARLEKL
jgi:hypothetical protein